MVPPWCARPAGRGSTPTEIVADVWNDGNGKLTRPFLITYGPRIRVSLLCFSSHLWFKNKRNEPCFP